MQVAACCVNQQKRVFGKRDGACQPILERALLSTLHREHQL